MRRHLFLVSAVVLGLVIASGSSARGYDHFQAFVGLWQAIDLNDGSTQLNEFVLNRKNNTLTNVNDDLLPAPKVFHRISRQASLFIIH